MVCIVYNDTMNTQLSKQFAKSLGIAIRNRRLELELSQETLADKADLHRTYIGMVERGERNITIFNLLKIATALDISLSDLLSFQGNIHE